MIRFHSPALSGLGKASLGAGLSLFAPTPAATQPSATNVLVTNATTQPVQVDVQGTPTFRTHPSYNQVQPAPTGLDGHVAWRKYDQVKYMHFTDHQVVP